MKLRCMKKHIFRLDCVAKKKYLLHMFLDWLNNRINNLNRTYMNMVYIARKIGRDRDKVIKDSSVFLFTDNFLDKDS